MPSERTLQALCDIRDNINLAMGFVATLSETEFRVDLRTFYAVTRCLEIISESARRLPPDVRDRHPGLPWRAIMGVGNVYRHDYDSVSTDIVWRTVRHSLTALLEVVEAEIMLPGQD